MRDALDNEPIEPTITRSGSMSIAIVFSKEQAAQTAQESPQLFLHENLREPRCAAASANDRFFDDD
jgi:hypothetical protein